MNKNLVEHYSSLSYPVKLYWDETDSVFVADFTDLPGCSAYGKTVQEVYEKAQRVKEEWLRTTIEQGYPIPEPSKESDYSGRFLLRMPSSLHSMLAEKSKLVGTSLNQYVVHLLSRSVVTDSLAGELASLKTEIAFLRERVESLSQTTVTYQAPNIIDVSCGVGKTQVFTQQVAVSRIRAAWTMRGIDIPANRMEGDQTGTSKQHDGTWLLTTQQLM